MAIGNSGSALFAGSCQQFVEMAPASTLTAHLVDQFNRRWGTVTASEELACALLRQTYRVLLTRGIRGTFVYSTDPETRGLLQTLLGPPGGLQPGVAVSAS